MRLLPENIAPHWGFVTPRLLPAMNAAIQFHDEIEHRKKPKIPDKVIKARKPRKPPRSPEEIRAIAARRAAVAEAKKVARARRWETIISLAVQGEGTTARDVSEALKISRPCAQSAMVKLVDQRMLYKAGMVKSQVGSDLRLYGATPQGVQWLSDFRGGK